MKKRKVKALCAVMAGTAGVTAAICHVLNKREKKELSGEEENIGSRTDRKTFYEKYVKRVLDVSISFCGLIVLSPVIAVSSAIVFLEDPGNVIFKQKRVGIHKTYFQIHKLRSMKQNCPDIPTHLMENPDQYILKSGKVFRKYSIDELTQLIDIIRGKMSIVGPRPALWNQDDLVAERDKYGANDVMPGLTGWAQINGRDELEIPVKAKLDGEYVQALKKSSISGFLMDCKCFIGTITSVLHHDGVVEGGTGELHKEENSSDTESVIGFEKSFTVNENAKKKVLITGAGSYIGESFESYAKEHYADNFEIDTLDMIDEGWENKDFRGYDIVYHVAGIAHADVGNVSEETKQKYYAVNTDLAIDTAKKAKEAGVKLFVFMSSMIVYGDSAPYGKQKMITSETKPEPANFYGDSKWQADKGVRALANADFKVAVLRPPMIYGKGSKGNYPTLAKMAKKLPVFPDVENQRSMLYIENLCEFLCQIFLVDVEVYSEHGNLFFPQNAQYTRTSEMVKLIAEAAGHRIVMSKVLAPMVFLAGKVPGKVRGLVDKAFGSNCYSQELSAYQGLEYQDVSLAQSIVRTEGRCESNMETDRKKVLFLVNHDVVIYNFRLELVERLLQEGYDVYVSSPYGERIEDLKELGCHYYDIRMDRHGMNPLEELKLFHSYVKQIGEIKPDIILGYTIKPNIYGAIVAQFRHIPFVANITGLGTAVENPGVKQRLLVLLYKFAFRKVQRVFFQNEENQQFFIDNKIAIGKHGLLPGSGVNLERNSFEEYPAKEDRIILNVIGRLMKDKGTDETLVAIRNIKKDYPDVIFRFLGFCDQEEYKHKIKNAVDEGLVEYLGQQRDVHDYIKVSCATIQASYHEGMSNVLLETAACGRPVIATNIPGCRETYEEGETGISCEQRNAKDLERAIREFIELPYDKKKTMGYLARKRMEKYFDRRIVVDAYIDEIRKIDG